MLPGSALQVRTSAHYQEIAKAYAELMGDAWIDARERVVAERNALSRKEQLTRYAHPSYKYVAMKEAN